MGTVYKKRYAKPLPANATVIERRGEVIAEWTDRNGKKRTAPVTRSESGETLILLTSSTYTAKFVDADGRVVERSTGCRDKGSARTILNRLQAEADEIRAGGTAAKYARYRRLPLGPQIDAFVDEHLAAKGATDGHRYNSRKLLEKLKKDCEFETLGDLDRKRFEEWLALQKSEGLSARGRNSYREVLVSFVNWCVAVGLLPENVFKAIPKANEKADPRRQRRALTEEEMVKLLDVARRRPLADALTVRRGKDKGKAVCKVRPEVREHLTLLGRERSLMYKVMLLTGLRRGELASLTVGQFVLDGPHLHVILEAADVKNREGARIPLRQDLAADIKAWLDEKRRTLRSHSVRQGKPNAQPMNDSTPVFRVPRDLVKILKRDLKAAGIPERDSRGRVIDVHALRTTFCTHLNKGGVPLRTAQAAMRHSDPKLTAGVYTDPQLLDVAGALECLPELSLTDSKDVDSRDVAVGDGMCPGMCQNNVPEWQEESLRCNVEHSAPLPAVESATDRNSNKDGAITHLERGYEGKEDGVPGGTRTPNLLVRSQALYPIELRVRILQAGCGKEW